MRHLLIPASILALASMPLAAEVPAAAAKVLLMVSKGAGENGRMMCKNDAAAADLRAAGVDVAPNSRIAFATNMAEVKMMTMSGKLVVGTDPKLLSLGAGIIVTQDGGRMKVMLNPQAISKSGVPVPDAVIKAAAGA